MAGNRERLVLVAFLAEATLAGGNAVGVKFSNKELDPLWGAGLRFALAALLLSVVAVVLRLPFPRGIAARSAFVYGALNFGAAFGLAYYALVELHAGFGQVLLATVPLVTLLVAVAERQERLSIAAAVGWGLVLGGILVIAGVYVGAIRVEAATPAPPEVPPAASALTTRAPRATLAG